MKKNKSNLTREEKERIRKELEEEDDRALNSIFSILEMSAEIKKQIENE